MSDQTAEDLMEKKKRQTDELNLKKWNPLKEMPIEQVLTDWNRTTFKREKVLVLEILNTEFQSHVHLHNNLLSEDYDLDKNFSRLIDKYKPIPSEKPQEIKRFLQNVCKTITDEHPEFACELHGVGSHHDGTKMFQYDEMDFILLLHFEAGTDYKVKPERSAPQRFNIFVENESKLGRSLDKQLIDKTRLKVKEYRENFVNVLKSVICDIQRCSGIKIGGWKHPHFGGFIENGPALTFLVEDVSIDLTLAWRAPKDVVESVLMWALADESCKVNLWSTAWNVWRKKQKSQPNVVFDRTLKNYTELGLLVMSGQDYCELSTSQIETSIIKTNEKLKEALSVLKIYKYQFFDFSWPDLTLYYTNLKKNIFEWIMDKLRANDSSGKNVVRPFVRRALRTASGMSKHNDYELLALLVLAAKGQPDTADRNISKKLQDLREYLSEIFIDTRSNGQFHPSLYGLLGEEKKTMIQVKSFIFKSLAIEEWIKSKEGITNTSDLVMTVMEKYLESHNSAIKHPLLSVSIRVQKIHSLCTNMGIEKEVARIQHQCAEAIINKVLDVNKKKSEV